MIYRALLEHSLCAEHFISALTSLIVFRRCIDSQSPLAQ
jgi:hypothetical protein